MKRITIICFVMCLSNVVFSQNAKQNKFTLESYKIQLVDCSLATPYIDTFADFKWDTSLVSIDTELQKILIEIVPIMDCFNNLEAKDLKKTLFVDIKDLTKQNIKLHKVTHKDMLSKCFKWRVRFVGKNETLKTSWNYHLFIK
jgi:hypothetical protein